MNDFTWKAKQFIRKWLPIALIAGLLYGGFTAYKRGAFRRSLVTGITSTIYNFPVLGSRFKQLTGGKSYSYGHGRKYRRGGRRYYGRRGARRRGRRR